MNLTNTYKKVKPACVAFTKMIGTTENHRLIGFGSGACVDPSGIIITAKHVVEDYINREPDFEIVFTKKGEKYLEAVAAKPIAMVMSEKYDVAVLKIPEVENGWPYFSFPKAWNTLEGEEVATSGFPLRDFHYSTTLPNLFSGIVSHVDERYIEGIGWDKTNLCLDISVHPGNSGGPVFKSNTGEVVGIIANQRLRETAVQNADDSQGIAGIWTNITNCVPWNQIKPLVEEMKEKYNLTRI
jgi:serine protease Do